VRNAFIETLAEVAREDERVFLLTADLGWSVVDRFAREFPRRFLNVGVAEGNMAGIAAGLAQVGFHPFSYSIATFASMRGYEAMRNGALLHGLPVRLIGIGGGFAYGHAGPTHHALEDLSLGRAQPGLTVLAPADPAQTRSVVRALAERAGPAYLRIGKGGNPEVPGLGGRFHWDRPEVVQEGRDILFITCGTIAHEALAAAAILKESGISAAVAVLAHLGFAPSPALIALLRDFGSIVSVEEGYAAGGLGSLVAEAVAQHGRSPRLRICGVTAAPTSGVVGSERYLRARNGLDAPALARAGREALSFA
jgi:transketolase